MTYPIVLAHGICRFDELLHLLTEGQGPDREAEPDGWHYFKGIRGALQEAGYTVYHADTPWAAPAEERARALRECVKAVLSETGADKVHLIAHSMGGLDARHMLYECRDEGLHRQVASLTTIGTPHLGTSLADAGVAGAGVAIDLFHRVGLDVEGLRDLTRPSCQAFNDRAAAFEDGCGVRFQTYAGSQPLLRVFLPLKPTWLFLNAQEGRNDGLVAVGSAAWRREYFQEEIDADHLNEIGWGDPDDDLFGEPAPVLEGRIRALYLKIAAGLVKAPQA